MRRTIAVLVVLALGLLLTSLVANASSSLQVVDRSGDGSWFGDTWQVRIYPGEVKQTKLAFYNTSTNPLEVNVTILPQTVDNGNLIFGVNNSVFVMTSNSYADVTLTAIANGAVTPGTYTVELWFEFEVLATPTPVPTWGGGGSGGGAVPTPRPTAVPTPRPTTRPTVTPVVTPTATPAATLVPSPTPKPTVTPVPTSQVTTPTLTPVAPESEGSNTGFWVGVGLAAAGFLTFAVFCLRLRRSKKKETNES